MAPPQWGRPLREGDVRAMAHDFDPDKLELASANGVTD